jgi:hypothetical protein
LGKDGAGGVVHTGQQVDLPALGAAGAAQRLAVDRDRPPPLLLAGVVAVGQPAADRGGQGLGVKPGQGAADRGFARDRSHPVAGAGIAAGSQRGTHGLGCVRRPLGDRGDRPRARQDRGSGQHQDADQRVPAPRTGPWVGDGGQVGEQERCLGWSERISVALAIPEPTAREQASPKVTLEPCGVAMCSAASSTRITRSQHDGFRVSAPDR